MKLKILDTLSTRRSSIAPPSKDDQHSNVINILNSQSNKEYLQQAQLLDSNNQFLYDATTRAKLSSVVEDVNAPESLRKAAHYIFYHGGGSQSDDVPVAANASFSFK